MSLAVWCQYFGTPKPADLYSSLPYTAQSPTLYKRIKFDKDELWNEVDRLLEMNFNRDKPFSIGQELYHQIPLFSNHSYFIEPYMWDIIQEYNWVKNFKVSLGNLDDVSAYKLDCFTIIDNEIQHCMNFKNG